MADIRAAQSGDFSATTTWVGGVVPGSGDVAFSNTFTVTISDARTVQAISNAAGTGITVGGTFSILNGCNLTCTNANGVVQGATSTSCITTTGLPLGGTAIVNANITTTVSNAPSVAFSTTGTLVWNGNTQSTSVGTAISVSGSGILTYTGNVGPGTNRAMLLNSGVANVTITGNVFAHTGGSSDTIQNNTAGALTINGSVTGPTTGTATALVNNSTGAMTVNGPIIAGITYAAIGVGSAAQNTRLSGPFLMAASGNINPVIALSWRWAPTQIPTYYEVPTSGGTTKRNMFTSDNIPTANYPAPANVRSGTVYGPNQENTGTLAVPVAGNVALGVPVDSTTGTAVLTSANVQTALGAFSSGRLNNVATVDSTGAQIQAAVSQ